MAGERGRKQERRSTSSSRREGTSETELQVLELGLESSPDEQYLPGDRDSDQSILFEC